MLKEQPSRGPIPKSSKKSLPLAGLNNHAGLRSVLSAPARSLVLDPTCGAGTFLIRAHARLNYLQQRKHAELLKQLWGVDIAKFPAHLATINLVLPDMSERWNFPRIIVKDAFQVYPAETHVTLTTAPTGSHSVRNLSGTAHADVVVPSFDAVVGNPPYIERRNLDANFRSQIGQVLVHDWGRQLAAFNRSSDIFVYLFVHAARFLVEAGRLGFVTSNGWLDNKYGWDLQRFFLENFKVIAVVESRVERSFTQADINTAITIIERCANAEERARNKVLFVSLRKPLSELIGGDALSGADRLVTRILRSKEFAENESFRVTPVAQSELVRQATGEDGEWIGGRWGALYLRAPDSYFRVVERAGGRLKPLREFAEGVLGTKTGCDEFFYVDRSRLAELGLDDEYVVPAFRSPQRVSGFKLSPGTAEECLVLISSPRAVLKGTSALKYIDLGERRHFHTRGECARRQRSLGRWYDLSPQQQCGRIAFPKTFNTRHAVFSNAKKCILGARFASLAPKEDVDPEVLLAVLNSSLTALLIEINGRTSLGQGALDFAVYEVLGLLVPDISQMGQLDRDALRKGWEALSARDPLPVEQEVHSPERVAIDKAVFRFLQLTDSDREVVVHDLLAMNAARLSRARTVEGVVRTSGTALSDEEVVAFCVVEAMKRAGDFRYPLDAAASIKEVLLPDDASGETKVSAFFNRGEVVWSEGGKLECPSLDAAHLAKLLLDLGVSSPLKLPMLPTVARKWLKSLEGYVKEYESAFQTQLASLGIAGAQVSRVKKRAHAALGEHLRLG
jgi:hypothetical protein